MAQGLPSMPQREPSKRTRHQNRKYLDRDTATETETETQKKDTASREQRETQSEQRPPPATLDRGFSAGGCEQDSRAQAELTALLQQCGCTSAAELGVKFADMTRRIAAFEELAEMDAEESDEPEESTVWATLQNCRGPEKQKADDRYLQCMGLKQKQADLKHPPGLSEIVLRQPEGAKRLSAADVKTVRLYGKSRSTVGAKPSDSKSMLLFECPVHKAADKDEIAARTATIGGLSAFALDNSVHLRLRKPTPKSSGGWKGPGTFPEKWFKWQPCRHKEGGVTVDDCIRPFSLELELENGHTVLCAVLSRLVSCPVPSRLVSSLSLTFAT